MNFKTQRELLNGIIPLDTYPRAFGILENAQTVSQVIAILYKLPKASTVGIEIDILHPDIVTSKSYREVNQNDAVYSQIAVHAKLAGHTVVWLEKPSDFLKGIEPTIDRFVELLRLKDQGQIPDKSLHRLAKEIDSLYERKSKVLFEQSAFRSAMMIRELHTKQDWQKTDIIVVGAAHLKNMQEVLSLDGTFLHGRMEQQDFRDVLRHGLSIQWQACLGVEIKKSLHHVFKRRSEK